MQKAVWLINDEAVLIGDIPENFDREPNGFPVTMDDWTVVFVGWHNVALVTEPPDNSADELLKQDALPSA